MKWWIYNSVEYTKAIQMYALNGENYMACELDLNKAVI